MKNILGPAAEKLRQAEEEGNPPVFDPSKFESELAREKLDARYALCEKYLGTHYPRVLKELLYEQMQSKAMIRGEATPVETKLVADLQGVLTPSIREALGDVVSVDYADGRILKIYFRPAGKDAYAVSASLLSTFRTSRDKYFLIVMECVRHHAATVAYDNEYKDKGYQGIATYLLPSMNARVKEAGLIHQRLASLNPADLDAVLDLFLILQQGDLPTSEEMDVPDDPKAWKLGDSPSFPTYVFRKTEVKVQVRDRWLDGRASALRRDDRNAVAATEREAAAAMAPVEEILADYQFYHLAQEQMDQLQDFLIEAKERNAIESKILKGMGVK